jgi:hypothetical protein
MIGLGHGGERTFDRAAEKERAERDGHKRA